jgi:hypothetical protein
LVRQRSTKGMLRGDVVMSAAQLSCGTSEPDAALSSKYKIEPMDLANMRQNGVRSLAVACFGCRHEVIVDADMYPSEFLVKNFGRRMVCTKCGMVGADVRPNWKERAR